VILGEISVPLDGPMVSYVLMPTATPPAWFELVNVRRRNGRTIGLVKMLPPQPPAVTADGR
jgi:hypothetical protein